MEIVIKLTSEDLKDNLVINTINNLFKHPQTEIEDLPPTYQQKPLKSTENTQKSKGKTKEERITELCDFANGKWKSLNEKEQKSLKAFVEFYKKKIMQQDFNINIANQWQKWWQNDKNNK